MNPNNRLALLEQIIELAQAAGDAILTVYSQDFSSEAKGDGSPVTVADIAAHHIIVDGLALLTPRVPVISEESPAPPVAERGKWPRHWLVDPLDGTREFIKKNGEFTVNIALIEGGETVLGVVMAPALGTTYAAAKGSGAWRIAASGERLQLATRTRPNKPVMMISRSHPDPAIEQLLLAVGEHESSSVGSSLKFCRIAEGLADCYPKLGSICEWDTAAAQCVLEAAGGAVLALPTLTALRYGGREAFRLPAFLAVGSTDARWPAAMAASLELAA